MSFLAHNIDIEYNGKKYHLDSADVLFGHKKELRGMPETWVKKIGSIGSVDYDYPFKSIELFVVTRDSSSVHEDTMLAVIKPQPRKGFRYSLAYINGKERLSQLLKDLKVSDSRKIKDMKTLTLEQERELVGKAYNIAIRKLEQIQSDIYTEDDLDDYTIKKLKLLIDQFPYGISAQKDLLYLCIELGWIKENMVSDSRKIKDANDTPDVLDGVLFIGFTDGTEDDMIAEVSKHKNESGEIGGVQYETYETDSSDGVAMIDLCAATDDANAFVKALLKEWGIAKNVADLEFEASDEMKEAVSDSRKIKDEWEDNESFYEYFGIQPATDEKTLLQGMDEILKGYSDREMAALQAERYLNISADIAKGWLAKKGISTLDEFKKWCAQRQSYLRKGKRQRDKEVDESFEKMRQEINLEKMLKQAYQTYDEYEKAHSVSDSKVNDMTKPAHLRGYAEKVRAKRRAKADEPTDEPLNEKQDVADSRDLGYAAYSVFENDEYVEAFYLEFDAIDYAESLWESGGGKTHVEVVRGDDTGVYEETVWSSDWEDERDSWGVL